MEEVKGKIRKAALQYADEAFAEHKDQVFAAFDIIIECRDTARRCGFLALEEKVEELRQDKGEDVPLKNLLIDLMQGLVDAADIDSWEEEIYRRIMKGGYLGYEWYIAEIYLMGYKNIYSGMGTRYYYRAFRGIVPPQWLEEFDQYWEDWANEEQAREDAGIREIAQKNRQRADAIRAAFCQRFKSMATEGILQVVREVPDKVLAAGIYGAEAPLRNRFLENMTLNQRNSIMERWNSDYRFCDVEKAMERMTIAAGLMGELTNKLELFYW